MSDEHQENLEDSQEGLKLSLPMVGAGLATLLAVSAITIWFVLSNKTGQVVDSTTHKALSGVEITVLGRDDLKTYTDDNGNFSLAFAYPADTQAQMALLNRFTIKAHKDRYSDRSQSILPVAYVFGNLVLEMAPDKASARQGKASWANAATTSVATVDSYPGADSEDGSDESTAEPPAPATTSLLAISQEMSALYDERGFRQSLLWARGGQHKHQCLVINQVCEQELKKKLRLMLAAGDQPVIDFLDNNRDEALALALYQLWDEVGQGVRNNMSFYLFESLINMESRYRCRAMAGNNEDGQRSREFRKRAYNHFLNEYDQWLNTDDAGCAVVLGVVFCDVMVSADATPVDDGEVRRTDTQRTAAAAEQQAKLFSTYIAGLNRAVDENLLPVTSNELYVARTRLSQMFSRPQVKHLASNAEVKQQWAILSKKPLRGKYVTRFPCLYPRYCN